MNISRYHAEWLELIEVSGPLVSMPVLLRTFPQGLDELEAGQRRDLRANYETWLERGQKHAGHHHAWIRYVLTRLLDYPEALLAEGQSMPPGMEAVLPRFHETLRPDLALKNRDAGVKPVMLVSIFPPETKLESPLPGRNWKASPATRMMELLHATGITTGLVTNGEQWMLVFARCGEATGFASWYADIWMQEPVTLLAFRSLLHLRRFFGVAASDTLPLLLDASSHDQQEVTDQLGYQVRQAVEVLVQAFDRIDAESARTLLAGVDEPTLYSASLTIMMRLVFVFAAEERSMLLLGQNAFYDENYALSPLRDFLRERADQHGEEVLERRYDAWCRLLAAFRAIHGGVEHEAMRLPAYGGALFDPDRYPFLEGRAPGTAWAHTTSKPLQINNRVVLHLLEALQLLRIKLPGGGPAEMRRISFRALDIEQIGHVYEGLLDHTVKRTPEVVLGLVGAKNKEPEIPLSKLEALMQNAPPPSILDAAPDQGDLLLIAAEREEGVFLPGAKSVRYDRPPRDLLDFLTEETGRHPNTLIKSLASGYAVDEHRLYRACGNDHQLAERVRPFAGLIREDSFNQLVIISEGSAYVTSGSDRRSSGTHYTPRSLTEPIVQHTLEPLVYIGPAEGKPEGEWVLKTPKELLDLRVCDLAMGSAAFLVQTCRYLSERLVEAWETIERSRPEAFLKTPEGGVSTGDPSERLLPADSEERLAIARRIVADRCLYGVDINPMAVEMAKLSLWLITLHKGRPFTFLDHALKCGDSLLGVSSIKQIENFSLRKKEGDYVEHAFSTINLFRYVEEASDKRLALEALASNDHPQIEAKKRLHAEAEAATVKVKALADCLIAFELRGVGDKQYAEQRIAAADQAELAMRKPLTEFQAYARDQLCGHRPFHWAVEFPEVFARGGFDAFVGNPPFMGGKKITGSFGIPYRDFCIAHIGYGKKGNADLSAYFVLRASAQLNTQGHLALVTTDTIAQGETREVGLQQALERGDGIHRAISSIPWPGAATVHFSAVWIVKHAWSGAFYLNGRQVRGINSFLSETGATSQSREQLDANDNCAFTGSYVLGLGFSLSPEEAATLIAQKPHNKDVLFPYMTGHDLNTNPDQSASRWAINFFDWPLDRSAEGSWTTADEDIRSSMLRSGRVPSDYPDKVAADYPDCLAIVEAKVKPERIRKDENGEYALRYPLFLKWWIYAEKRPALYSQLRGKKQVLGISQLNNHFGFVFVKAERVFDQKMVVFMLPQFSQFTVLQSSFHYSWIWHFGTTNLSLINYSPTTCFQTFPMPDGYFDAKTFAPCLNVLGKTYHELRAQIMQTRQEGLTKTYNRFHDQGEQSADIVRLRALHVELDQAVAATYGWNDLDLGHGFHETKQGIRYTISESARRIVLDRLLALNHERYAEEVKAGPHEKKKPAASTKRAKKEKQTDAVKETGTPYMTQELSL